MWLQELQHDSVCVEQVKNGYPKAFIGTGLFRLKPHFFLSYCPLFITPLWWGPYPYQGLFLSLPISIIAVTPPLVMSCT